MFIMMRAFSFERGYEGMLFCSFDPVLHGLFDRSWYNKDFTFPKKVPKWSPTKSLPVVPTK